MCSPGSPLPGHVLGKLPKGRARAVSKALFANDPSEFGELPEVKREREKQAKEGRAKQQKKPPPKPRSRGRRTLLSSAQEESSVKRPTLGA